MKTEKELKENCYIPFLEEGDICGFVDYVSKKYDLSPPWDDKKFNLILDLFRQQYEYWTKEGKKEIDWFIKNWIRYDGKLSAFIEEYAFVENYHKNHRFDMGFWKKKNIKHKNIYGKKDSFAWELLANDIIKIKGFHPKMTFKEAQDLLEKNGWKWSKK